MWNNFAMKKKTFLRDRGYLTLVWGQYYNVYRLLHAAYFAWCLNTRFDWMVIKMLFRTSEISSIRMPLNYWTCIQMVLNLNSVPVNVQYSDAYSIRLFKSALFTQIKCAKVVIVPPSFIFVFCLTSFTLLPRFNLVFLLLYFLSKVSLFCFAALFLLVMLLAHFKLLLYLPNTVLT